MHDHLWRGVNGKIEEAHRSLREMGRLLDPPEQTHWNVALESAGAVLDTRWQDNLYAHVGTFLAKVRSVPSIIEACFGIDRGSRQMRDWLDGLPPDERLRRQTFSDQFRADKEAFRKHHLTTERDVSEHRLGFPNVEGRVVGPFGQVHIAGPDRRIPTAEPRPLEANINNDPALQWAATLPPRPVRPHWDQFTIAGKPLFPECRAYLQLASDLCGRAQKICDAVHGGQPLSTPPTS
jgi:hypothetical protein